MSLAYLQHTAVTGDELDLDNSILIRGDKTRQDYYSSNSAVEVQYLLCILRKGWPSSMIHYKADFFAANLAACWNIKIYENYQKMDVIVID